MLSVTKDDQVVVAAPSEASRVKALLTAYKDAKSRLLLLEFVTLTEYLWTLRVACEELGKLSRVPRVMLYLAAAVSDFYVPSDQMVEHKLQSSSGPPTLSLRLVPKMLAPVTSVWIPDAFTVSFKLETDERILIDKARVALDRYRHQLVVANLLQNRKQSVKIISKPVGDHGNVDVLDVTLTDLEMANGAEIEEKLVNILADLHSEFIQRQTSLL